LKRLNDILPQVTRPARYTGGEWNSMIKDWAKTPIRVALVYPDLYEIGMSNMALPILYDLLNSQPDVLAERVFAPWPDMATALQTTGIPLFSLETRHPLKDFDIIGFSLGYELTYTNVLNILHLAQIPVLAAERNSWPLVIAGGSCALNPEPMADFIDLFAIGEGEEVLLEFIECFRHLAGAPKEQLLHRMAAIPGIYVPSLYQVAYQADGTLKNFTPTVPQASPVINRRLIAKLPPPVTKPVVPFIETVHDRGAIEIQRGCTRGCRFCQAGMIYRPVRERPPQEITQAVADIIANCGYDEISLVSLSSSDYSDISTLITSLANQYKDQPLTLSLPSLRVEGFLEKLKEPLSPFRKVGLTFAPEAASERLQNVINKRIPEAAILQTAATAFEMGWNHLKLYFMLGLPTETTEDIEAIIQLVNKVRSLSKKAQLRISLSTFVPKPHTPFQWLGQAAEPAINQKHELLKEGLRKKGVKISWPDPRTSLLEAVLARGDRRLGPVIYRAWQAGATFDAWNEHLKYDNWLRAFEKAGLNPGFYAHRERPAEELLPWSHINTGVTTAFLKREYQRALNGEETPDCRHDSCNACGFEKQSPDCQHKHRETTQSR